MQPNSDTPASIRSQREHYLAGLSKPRDVVEAALTRSNSNLGKNVYLSRDEAWSLHEAERLSSKPTRDVLQNRPLWGIPVSLKDCFDLEGFVTTCGSKALGDSREVAVTDSTVADRLRKLGAIITGKTHLHQLAYGITGENSDFGDCLQPANLKLLTGGSSSGAAASVQEGSAMAAIGTDTGGSIRVPAALCGLAGYRASVTVSAANGLDLWRGGEHLAASFDTIGWIYRDLSDGPLIGAALFGLPEVPAPPIQGLRVGLADGSFLYDCEQEVLATLEAWATLLESRGARMEYFDTAMWNDTKELFPPLQASEAAALHPEPRDHFEPVIAERLRWGASLSQTELKALRNRLASFRQESELRLQPFDVLLLPNSPKAELLAGADHSGTRAMILRYTMPASILGRPAVTLTSRRGAPQLIGRVGSDAELLALTATLADYAN